MAPPRGLPVGRAVSIREHGTPRGAAQHRRRGEVVCRACNVAENARKLAYTAARRAAAEALIKRHPEEFLGLFAAEKSARGLTAGETEREWS